jgi:hypothetical protein
VVGAFALVGIVCGVIFSLLKSEDPKKKFLGFIALGGIGLMIIYGVVAVNAPATDTDSATQTTEVATPEATPVPAPTPEATPTSWGTEHQPVLDSTTGHYKDPFGDQPAALTAPVVQPTPEAMPMPTPEATPVPVIVRRVTPVTIQTAPRRELPAPTPQPVNQQAAAQQQALQDWHRAQAHYSEVMNGGTNAEVMRAGQAMQTAKLRYEKLIH